ncbi:MAG TPA: hypothetical protein VIO11_03695 [Candidatus Methanoperedens sp.]
MNFNIHNLFKFKIEGTDKNQLDHFCRDYSYFRTNEEIESELDIKLSDFIPDTRDCHIINHKYYIKNNYIYCSDRYKVVKWRFCIQDIDTRPTVYFKGGMFSETFSRDYIIEPLIALKMAQKGYSLMHASGVALNDKGFIFPACKGVGKTSTMLNLMEDGGTYLGNEPIIISNNGKVYSFPSYIHFYHYNLKGTSSFSKNLSAKDRIELELKHLLYLLSFKYGSFPLDIDHKKLFKKAGDEYPLQGLILLSKTNRNELNILENIEKDALIERLITINKFEMQYFSDILMAYLYVFPDSITKSFWKISEDNLRKSLSNIICHEVEIPMKFDQGVYREINQLIQKTLLMGKK